MARIATRTNENTAASTPRAMGIASCRRGVAYFSSPAAKRIDSAGKHGTMYVKSFPRAMEKKINGSNAHSATKRRKGSWRKRERRPIHAAGHATIQGQVTSGRYAR